MQVQKPGLRFAASEFEWASKFNRRVKEGARPLVILWPFGPVAFLYDVEDTDGEYLPEDIVNAFSASGAISAEAMPRLVKKLESKYIFTEQIEWGDGRAGYIEAEIRAFKKGEKPRYKIRLNANHSPSVQFSTLAHELAHLYLGHLGKDIFLNISDRSGRSMSHIEIEAESAAYVVCMRHGVQPNSQSYLSSYLNDEYEWYLPDIDVIFKAAGKVETALGLAPGIRFK